MLRMMNILKDVSSPYLFPLKTLCSNPQPISNDGFDSWANGGLFRKSLLTLHSTIYVFFQQDRVSYLGLWYTWSYFLCRVINTDLIPVFPVPYVEDAVSVCFWNLLIFNGCSYLYSCVGLLFCSIGLHVILYGHDTVCITPAWYYVLRSGMVIPPLLFLLRIALAIRSFVVSCEFSAYFGCRDFDLYWSESVFAFGKIIFIH